MVHFFVPDFFYRAIN